MPVGNKPIRTNDSAAALSSGPLDPLRANPPTAAGTKTHKGSSGRDSAPRSKSRSSIVFDLISGGSGTTSATPTSKSVSVSRSPFAQRKSLPPRISYQSSDLSTPSPLELDKMMRNIDRPPPGDPMSPRKSQVHPEVQRKRSTYFEAEFAASNRDPDPARSRVENEAPVLAELKTNVIVSRTVKGQESRTLLTVVADQG